MSAQAWILVGFVVYLLIGAGLAWLIDFVQMKKHVPYGDFPSIFSTQQARRITFALLLVFGAPMAAVALWKIAAKEIRVLQRWRRRRRSVS